jgi:LacI family transcriptional regulator
MRSDQQRPPLVRTVAVCIDTRDGAGRKRLYGAAQYGRQHGWLTMLVRYGGRQAAQEVLRLRPDGILAFFADRWLLDAARNLNVPLVDTACGENEVPFLVTLNSDTVGRLAAEHLLSLGLDCFGYCGVRGMTASEDRRASLARHLGARGHSLQAFSQRVAEGESQIAPLMNWLSGLPRPVGVLTFNDALGERVLTACRWAGLSVPEQVAVIGVGDDELMCEVSWPPLSSIRFATSRLGYEGADMLARAMAGMSIGERVHTVEPTDVIVRASTDTLATGDPLVRAAVRFIREHAGEPIGVQHVATGLDVSRRTLDRRFLARLGRTVHDELASARMRVARRLLSEESRSVAEIAAACGYSTAASFSRAFQHYVGCWPTDYRNEIRLV